MNWTYIQKTGAAISPSGVTEAHGYSGNGEGLNNPAMEKVHGVGPIPAGLWVIGLTPLQHTTCGPLALPLTPDGWDAYGRTEFRIHGDNPQMNHTASDGCIILPRDVRQKIIDTGVTHLLVVHE